MAAGKTGIGAGVTVGTGAGTGAGAGSAVAMGAGAGRGAGVASAGGGRSSWEPASGPVAVLSAPGGLRRWSRKPPTELASASARSEAIETSVGTSRADDQPLPVARAHRTWWRSGWVLFGAPLAVVLVAAAVVRVPYYLLGPGQALPTAPRMEIEGAEIYQPRGQLLLTTASQSRGRINLYELAYGWLDDDVEVLGEEEVRGGLSRSQERRQGRMQIDLSKLVAGDVALQRLGYPVSLVGDGARVVGVQEGFPADGVLHEGDVIVAVGESQIRTSEDAVAALRATNAGEEVGVTRVRAGTTDRIILRTRAAPDDGRPLIGVRLETENLRPEFPFRIAIDTDEIGGPSAGLAFTLGLLDVLTPGELTGGRRVAVTGTILPDGTAGPVGGVRQKAAAARAEHAELFIVPADALVEAEKHAGDMQVVGVKTLDDALAALERAGGEPLPPRPPL